MLRNLDMRGRNQAWLTWVALFAALTVTSGGVSAREGAEASSALGNIKRAGSTCANEATVPYKPGLRAESEAIAPADLSCAISPSNLHRTLRATEMAIVDVRPGAAAPWSGIEGSMQVTLSELRSKHFLRQKDVVLVGSGKAESELYLACADLKRRGFKSVKVLHGGIPAWISQGFETVGEPKDAESTLSLTPSELWREAKFAANIVVVETKQARLAPLLPKVDHMVPDLKPGTLKAAVGKAGVARAGARIASVVLVVAPETPRSQLTTLRAVIKPLPMLVFSGTETAYQDELKQQKRIWEARDNGPKALPCGL